MFDNVGLNFNKKEILKQTKVLWPRFWEYATLCPIDLVARNIKLSDESAAYFEQALGENPYGSSKVRKLDISKNSFGKNIKLFVSCFAKNQSITHLDLS